MEVEGTVMHLESESSDDNILNDMSTRDEIVGAIDDNQIVDCDDEQGPQVGMSYTTFNRLRDAYKRHAYFAGFNVITSESTKRGKGYTVYAQLSCDRGKVKKNRKKSKRIGCDAKLSASLTKGKWVVLNIIAEHNHELQPQLTGLLPSSQTNLILEPQRELDSRDLAGLRPSTSSSLLQVQSRGAENIGCLPNDCRNLAQQGTTLRLSEGDAEALSKLFLDLQTKEPTFFHLIENDSEGRMKSALWIHPRGKAAFEDFNDAVWLDTTYIVNGYKMPLATFVGVNHHGQSILLGCALIYSFDVASLKWMFKTWKEAMGRQPQAMLTDQCDCLSAAIAEVFPNTVHRFCAWHILCKVPDKFNNDPDCQNATSEFNDIVYGSLSLEDFERKWNDFIYKRSLQSNPWLTKLYAEREKWVPIMLRDIFWAGMLSTDRRKKKHGFYDACINSMSTLQQFVEKYESAMADKIQKEMRAESDTKHKTLPCETSYHFERQYKEAFTNDMFKEVQNQISKMIYCFRIHTVDDAQLSNGVQKLKIQYRRPDHIVPHDEEFTVEYRLDGQHYECSCKHFEVCGYPCAHIFKALTCVDISTVDKRYIKDRWRKDIQWLHTMAKFQCGNPHMKDKYLKYEEMELSFQKCAEMCMDSQEKQNRLKRGLNSLSIEFSESTEQARDSAASGPHSQGENETVVRDPLTVRSRGRPRLNTLHGVNNRRRRGRGNQARGRRNVGNHRDGIENGVHEGSGNAGHEGHEGHQVGGQIDEGNEGHEGVVRSRGNAGLGGGRIGRRGGGSRGRRGRTSGAIALEIPVYVENEARGIGGNQRNGMENREHGGNPAGGSENAGLGGHQEVGRRDEGNEGHEGVVRSRGNPGLRGGRIGRRGGRSRGRRGGRSPSSGAFAPEIADYVDNEATGNGGNQPAVMERREHGSTENDGHGGNPADGSGNAGLRRHQEGVHEGVVRRGSNAGPGGRRGTRGRGRRGRSCGAIASDFRDYVENAADLVEVTVAAANGGDGHSSPM